MAPTHVSSIFNSFYWLCEDVAVASCGGKFPPTSEEAHFSSLARACSRLLCCSAAHISWRVITKQKSESEVHESWLFSIGIICLFMNLIVLGYTEKLFYCLFWYFSCGFCGWKLLGKFGCMCLLEWRGKYLEKIVVDI